MLKLKAEKRSIFGKKLKKSRVAGKLPIVVYGNKSLSEPLFVESRDFTKLFREAGESTIISLDVEGAAPQSVLIHEVTFHPVLDTPVHADFYVIDKDKKIEIAVPLQFVGEAPAVKEFSGTLVKVMHEIEIEVLPMHLPQHLLVDLSVLKDLEHPILVRDIILPESAKLLVDPNDVVAAVSVAHEEIEEVAPAPDLSTIEVVKKGKKEDKEALEEGDKPAANA
jgi:large subunit ribosomal protein L25